MVCARAHTARPIPDQQEDQSLPVLYVQARLKRESRRSASIDAPPAWFHAWFRRWFALGIPAFVAVIPVRWLMTARPLAVAGA